MVTARYEGGDVVLTWEADPAAFEERVVIRDAVTGEYPYKESAPDGTHRIAAADIPGQGHFGVMRRYTEAEEWDLVAPMPRLWPTDPAVDGAAFTWEAAGDGPYRVLIHDDGPQVYVCDDVVCQTVYPIPWTELDPDRSYRVRVMAWDGSTWIDHLALTPIAPPLEIIIGARRERPATPLDLSDGEQLLVLFTVDTEGALRQMRKPQIGEVIPRSVFGDFPGGPTGVGIGLHMDLLEKYGFKGCFFIDVLWEYHFGRETLERAIEEITSRGHEVQPHLHPTHLRLSPHERERQFVHGIYGHDKDTFRGALDVAVRLFTERTGKEPVAYRAGGYNICEEYLEVLPEFGISIDSSVNSFKNYRMPEALRTRTQPYFVGDVLEVPVSWMVREDRDVAPYNRQFSPFRYGAGQEAFTRLPVAGRSAPATLVYVSHSYQLLETSVEQGREVVARWNEELEAGNDPDVAEIARAQDSYVFSFIDGPVNQARVMLLDRTLRQLASRPEVRFVTFEELAAADTEVWRERRDGPTDPIPVYREQGGPGVLHAQVHCTPEPLPAIEDGPVAGVEAMLDAARLTAGTRTVVWAPEGVAEAVGACGPAVVAQSEGDEPPIPEEPVDAVVCLDVLHRLTPGAALDAMVALHDALRPGGALVFRAPTCFSGEHGTIEELYWGRVVLGRRAPSHAQTAPSLLLLLRRAGFAGAEIRTLRREEDVPSGLLDKLGLFGEEERRAYAVEFVGHRRRALELARYALLTEVTR